MALFFGGESSEILREEYLNYLKESEVFPKLLEILNKLHKMKTRPRNPMEFIRKELGSKPIPMETLLYMECDLNDARDEIKRLKRIIKRLGIKYEEKEEKIDPVEDKESNQN